MRVTGEIRREIRMPADISDGPVWKWMAMQDDVLYALVGNLEVKVETMRSNRPGLGHWPWGMWKGHDYKDPRTAFGYGRTLVAIDRQYRRHPVALSGRRVPGCPGGLHEEREDLLLLP